MDCVVPSFSMLGPERSEWGADLSSKALSNALTADPSAVQVIGERTTFLTRDDMAQASVNRRTKISSMASPT